MGRCVERSGPKRLELTCHRVLAQARADDPRAAAWLQRAHTALMAEADAITRSNPDPALRHGLLNNIPHHRDIVAAWAAASPRTAHTGASPLPR